MSAVEVLEVCRIDVGNLKAFAKVRLGCVVIHGCRVIQQEGQRPWVASRRRRPGRGPAAPAMCWATHPFGSVHQPSTKRPYRWRNGELMEVDLPQIDEASAKTTPQGQRRVDARSRETEQASRCRDHTLAKRIDTPDARRLKGGSWITASPAHKSEGAGSLSITPRDGGGSVVHGFAECSFADISDAISSILGSR